MSVHQADPGIGRDLYISRRQDGYAALPGNYECAWIGQTKYGLVSGTSNYYSVHLARGVYVTGRNGRVGCLAEIYDARGMCPVTRILKLNLAFNL